MCRWTMRAPSEPSKPGQAILQSALHAELRGTGRRKNSSPAGMEPLEAPTALDACPLGESRQGTGQGQELPAAPDMGSHLPLIPSRFGGGGGGGV